MLRKIVLGVLLAAALVAAVAWLSWSPGPDVYEHTASVAAIPLQARFRTWAEHDAIVEKTWPKPYVLELDHLVFYGAHHTSDRHDPQLTDIEARWNAFKPTVALNEGRRRGYFLGPFAMAGSKSESQRLHELARRDGVAFYSLEPPYEEEVGALLKTWTPEQVALYFTLRVYWGESGGTADEGLAEHLRKKRTDVDGLRGSLATVADIDRVWKRDLPGQADWRTLTEEPNGSILAAIADDSRRVRGEYMARTIIDLVRKGERVFAVVGSGHVIRIEWLLRQALGPRPD
ncbi:MAG TPA: hypothetical protein VFV54_04980 [Thermoanaerobaculia bacterium]|nr:hypothetical protein [Thermoanaerobaculia bacterium]